MKVTSVLGMNGAQCGNARESVCCVSSRGHHQDPPFCDGDNVRFYCLDHEQRANIKLRKFTTARVEMPQRAHGSDAMSDPRDVRSFPDGDPVTLTHNAHDFMDFCESSACGGSP